MAGATRVDEQQVAAHLAQARSEAHRLRKNASLLHAVGLAIVVLAGARGVAALVAPVSLGLGIAIGAAVATGVGVLFRAGHVRREASRATDASFALALARDILAREERPLLEAHPYRAHGPAARPRIVVRTAGSELPGNADAAREEGFDSRSLLARAGAAVLVLVALLLVVETFAIDPKPAGRRWTFLETASSLADLGFESSDPSSGRWSVEDHDAATGQRALANASGEPSASAATLIAPDRVRDVALRTRCRTSRDAHAQQCGLVFRYVDARTYDVSRLDTTSASSVSFARVREGVETEVAHVATPVAADAWHELAVEVRGNAIRIFVDSRRAIELSEPPPSAVYRVGLWAPAVGRAWFDELSVESLTRSASNHDAVPFLGRRAK